MKKILLIFVLVAFACEDKEEKKLECDKELDEITEFYEREISMAGNNATLKLNLLEDYNKVLADWKNKCEKYY